MNINVTTTASTPKPQTLEEQFARLAAAYVELATAYGALVAQRSAAPVTPWWQNLGIYQSGVSGAAAPQLPILVS